MNIESFSLDFLGHSGFLIGASKRIAIDPYNVSENVEPVDFILITHSHFDHCSIKDIQKLSKKGTIIVATPDSQSKILRVDGVEMHPVEVGDAFELDDITIETVAAYNAKKAFHPKKEGWVGYIVKIGNFIVYHAGDTDLIKEMKHLTGYGKKGNTFVTLLPVSGTYVMDAEEAADAAELLSPHLAIPIHYGAGVAGTLEDAERFVTLCKEKGVHAEILPKL